MKVAFALALAWALPCAALAQIAGLQIKILAGNDVVHQPGARAAQPLAVEVTDDAGRPVSGAAVSFHLPTGGASGVFANGLRSDLVVTDASGRAAGHSIQLNRTTGPLQIRITAVKEQARASAIATQYIGDRGAAQPQTARSGDITPTTGKMASGSHKKWLILAAVAAAGAGAAVVGMSHGSKSGSSSSSTTAVTSIGTPNITVGHP